MQKFVLVPVEPTEEMSKAGMRWLTGIQHMRAGDKRNALNEAFKAMAELAPQPPTFGGEPEVTYMLRNTVLNTPWQPADKAVFDSAASLVEYERCEMVDRAHVARLQAEVERLNARLSSEQDRVMATIGQYAKFEARTAELEGLLRDFRAGNFSLTPEIHTRIDAALAEGKEHE